MTIITAKGVYDANNERAGWACTVFDEITSRQVCYSGPMSGIASPSQADLAAIQCAIETAIQGGVLSSMSRVEIRTNCQEAVAVLLSTIPASRVIGDTLVAPAKKVTARLSSFSALRLIREHVQKHNLAVVFRVAMDRSVVERARDSMPGIRR